MLNLLIVLVIALTMGALLEVVRRTYPTSGRSHLPRLSRRRR